MINDEVLYPIKVVLVGGAMVGKTQIIKSYCTDEFLYDYNATVFSNYTCNVPISDKEIEL